MKQIVEFREKLLILMHFIDDQSTRTFEILSVRHYNIIRKKHRNIFVENELIVFVIRDHKEYSMKKDVKMIHRYLSQEMKRLLMYYLLLILPFQQRLKLTIWKKKSISAFLWLVDSKRRQFTSKRMRKCMKGKTEMKMSVKLIIQMYREINIVMNRRWIRKQNAFRMNENDENDEWNENDSNQIANEQVEHTFHVTKMIYVRNIMKRNDEVISKRQRFREINESWHIFLRFQFVIDKKRLLIRKDVQDKRKIVSFQTETENARFFPWKRLKNMDFQRQLRQMLSETKG